ncbi:MAG: IS3 family transposase [Haliea sp.]|nr:IS3 family transposase [Haliea sp.]
MTKQTGKKSAPRRQHAPEFRAEALALAEKVGVAKAAKELGLHESQLYSWRTKARASQDRVRWSSNRLSRLPAQRRLAEQAEELAIVKGGHILRQKPEVKYVFMEQNAGSFRVTTMVRVLKVSRSGFYRWRERQQQPSPRQEERRHLDEVVKEAFERKKSRYGSPRLTLDLAEAGHQHDRKTVANSLRRQGLRAKAAKKFKATTNSNHDLPVAPNLLNQDFTATAPNQKYVGDITYLWTDEGWLYLATVIDLYSRMVVGWAMSERMTSQLVCDALKMALWRRGMPTGVIVHSDRGSQYCSGAYQALLDDHGLICSMSGRGNCYDNACAESFFHSLKVEAVHGEHLGTREEMRQAVFEYIEVDYNRDRRHSANGNISPAAFEAKLVA